MYPCDERDLAMLSLWDLSVARSDERSFRAHAEAAYRSWDALSIAFGLAINVIIYRYAINHAGIELLGLTACVVVQLVQAAIFVARPKTHSRFRTQFFLLNRSLRLANTSFRFWPARGSAPTSSIAFQQAVSVIGNHGAWRAVMMVVLLEPLMSLMHAVFHVLPFRHHLAFALARAMVDVTQVGRAPPPPLCPSRS